MSNFSVQVYSDRHNRRWILYIWRQLLPQQVHDTKAIYHHFEGLSSMVKTSVQSNPASIQKSGQMLLRSIKWILSEVTEKPPRANILQDSSLCLRCCPKSLCIGSVHQRHLTYLDDINIDRVGFDIFHDLMKVNLAQLMNSRTNPVTRQGFSLSLLLCF